jgi:hypothetical protein
VFEWRQAELRHRGSTGSRSADRVKRTMGRAAFCVAGILCSVRRVFADAGKLARATESLLVVQLKAAIKGVMMAVVTAALLTRVTRPVLGYLLLSFVALSFGCVDLSTPRVLASPDGAAGSTDRGGDASAGAGGTGPGSSAGTGGASDSSAGTGGTGGSASGGIAFDAGVGGSTSPSTSGPGANGGNTEIDAPSTDLPLATGGVVPDAGTGGSGGSAGKTGSAGSAGLDAGAGNSGAGKTSSAGRTAGSSGTAGQGGGGAGGRDAAVPDAAPPDAPCALCAIGATLVHRYSFSGTGTTVTDSVGTANGSVKNAQLSGSGTVVLAGGTTNQYVEFPTKILSTLTSATLEIWVTWTGGSNNQRILDFGSNKTSGSNTSAVTTVIISPNSYIDSVARLRASYCNDTSVADSSIFADATSTLATGAMAQIVAVFDGQNHTLALYLNGVLQDQATDLGALSKIDDANNWLGKSQYSNDPGFAGTYHELRIYNAPLTAAQVQAVHTAGTGASFTQ